MKARFAQTVKPLILTAFFLSGGCGLVYEVLWTRYLADLMGATALSQMVVLMVYMGGLAVGALWFGRLVDRCSGKLNGLVIYGFLELAIGLYGVAFPFLFAGVERLFPAMAAGMTPGAPALVVLKILSAVLLIAFPSVAMGGTLPVLTRYLTGSRIFLRRNIALLYGFNSLGAVLGVLAGGFYLVHRYGMASSMVYTGLIGILLGLAALGGARLIARYGAVFTEPVAVDLPRRRTEERLDRQVYHPYAVRRAVVAAGLSGFVAMALQVAWLRYFGVVLGATHSAFTIVVAAFIFGIGLGSLLVGTRMIGRLPLPTVLAGAFALNAAFMGFGLLFYARAPFEIGRALSIFAATPLAWLPYEVMKFTICFVLMLPSSLAAGMIPPICVRIAGRAEEHIGRDVALVYTVNTLGALLGTAATSQGLFRLLPLPYTLQFILFAYIGWAVFLAFILEEKGRKRIFALLAVVVVSHLFLWRPWPPHHLYVNQLRFGRNPPLTYDEFLRDQRRAVVVSEKQGPDVQVAVIDTMRGEDSYRTMYINGKPDASNDPTGPDLVTEILLARLPLLLHPNPGKVFVLGVGSGITSGEALNHPGVGRVVTVELAREVFEAAKYFAADNGRFWENSRHRMVIEDGKTFLQLSKEKFDVIALEPTNIWQEGMAGLFSEEFFRLARARLAEGGVMAQWLHTYKVDNRTLNIVLKTFSRVFPDAAIFEMESGDILLLGFDNKWRFDPMAMEHDFFRPEIYRSLRKIGITSPAALLLREIMGREDFRAYTRVLSVPVNTDNFPVLEQAAEYGRFIGRSATLLPGHDSRLDPDNADLLFTEYSRRLGFDEHQTRKLIDSEIVAANPRLKNSLVFKLLLDQAANGGAGQAQTLLPLLTEPLLREVVLNPAYRLSSYLLSAEDAYRMIGGELLIWSRASSFLWPSDAGRLHDLYGRV
ncbi:MAG: hypothetical protein RQ753_09010, partial [Desulfurivibrionaceae bacterium]|nr:hypothetical protein [Desulfurivibrionaceae bacterium]